MSGRCFNTVPPGIATCIGRGDANPPILQFDPSGKLLKSLGGGMFANPHGLTVDNEGNLWVSDVNDKQTVLGMPARNAAGRRPRTGGSQARITLSSRSGQWRIFAGTFVGKPCRPCGRLIRPLRHLDAPSRRLGR
jgi:NHL repeat-containing protein